MEKKEKNNCIMVFVCCLMFFGCTTPYELKQEENFDDRLVVEGKLTDELNFQRIKLTRTYLLNKWTSIPVEKNASVKIIEDGTTSFEYEEKEPGIYVSKIKFKAIPNKTYSLEIKLSSGKKYASVQQELPAQLNSNFDLVVAKGTNKEGVSGVFIDYVNKGGGDSVESSYYRFDHTSTYKIVVPAWFTDSLVVNSTIRPHMVVKGNEIGRVCYQDDLSSQIIMRNASKFKGNAVDPFNIKFLPKSDHKIYYRYSIIVNQYVISKESYAYFNTLKDFSESTNVFSENQPGNIIGNMISLDDDTENVIGFFEVVKKLSKRVFFNYTDFYVKSSLLSPTEFYFVDCDISTPTLRSRGIYQPLSLNEMLLKELVVLLNENKDNPGGPYQVVTKACGDCRVLGDVKKPDFWID